VVVLVVSGMVLLVGAEVGLGITGLLELELLIKGSVAVLRLEEAEAEVEVLEGQVVLQTLVVMVV
jgi:hypothetical protein